MPFCAACAHSKVTRCPLRSRSTNNKDEASTSRDLGKVISVDQMISPTPLLIDQMTDMLTNKRYTWAILSVNQSSEYSFIWVQKSTNIKESLEGKRAFKAHMPSSGIVIWQYYANNGVFKARAWVDDCQLKNQRVTCAGVGVYHQNGVAKRQIWVLQELTWAQLAHAAQRWPEAITANLWPCQT